MFESLLKLIDRDSNKTPLEDFTTEILTGILRSDQKIMDGYVKEVLGVEGSNFELETQVIYEEVSGDKSKPDMVFSNKDTLIFQENKVESKEGDDQLLKYNNVLSKQTEENKHLRYCTKYYSKKEVSGIDFKQFRWMNVYSYLKRHADNNQLIKYFMEFLEEKNMKLPKEFTTKELEILPSLIGIILKTNEVIDQGKGILKESFKGTVSKCTTEDIVDHEGVYISVKNILSGKEDCGITLSINYGEAWDILKPTVSAHIYIVDEHGKYKKVKEDFSKSEDKNLKMKEYGGYLEIYYQELLENLIASAGNDIMSWYEKHIELFYDHCKKSNLGWSIV